MFTHKIISTGLGIGYIGKGGGTVAAVFACICWYVFQTGDVYPSVWALPITIILTILGIVSGNKVETIWGKDHARVVMDEIVGMCITLLWVPVKWEYILLGLVLFRFFDIVKPLFIRKLEALPGGWGVMADDVLAGIYANIILQLVIILNIL